MIVLKGDQLGAVVIAGLQSMGANLSGGIAITWHVKVEPGPGAQAGTGAMSIEAQVEVFFTSEEILLGSAASPSGSPATKLMRFRRWCFG